MKSVDWVTAINSRKSTRLYDRKPVPAQLLADLQQFVRNAEFPFQHEVEVRFFRAEPNKRLANNLKNPPPDNFALLADTDVLSISKAGFVGELVILYATNLGLSTCWFGHYSLAELERLMPHLEDPAAPKPAWGYGTGEVSGRRAICISPLGIPSTEGLRLLDRMTGSLMSFKRKPIGALLENGMSEDSLPATLRLALDLARKAPSAANAQFWRFAVSPDFRTVDIAMPVGYRHLKWEHPNVDIGACACHFWLGLEMQHIASQVTISEDQGRAVWHFVLNPAS